MAVQLFQQPSKDNVFTKPTSRSLHSNGSTRYNILQPPPTFIGVNVDVAARLKPPSSNFVGLHGDVSSPRLGALLP
jgi:hypothetical protein